jgi:hypothetical protein
LCKVKQKGSDDAPDIERDRAHCAGHASGSHFMLFTHDVETQPGHSAVSFTARSFASLTELKNKNETLAMSTLEHASPNFSTQPDIVLMNVFFQNERVSIDRF